jgi:hypothetical protein
MRRFASGLRPRTEDVRLAQKRPMPNPGRGRAKNPQGQWSRHPINRGRGRVSRPVCSWNALIIQWIELIIPALARPRQNMEKFRESGYLQQLGRRCHEIPVAH